MHYRTVNAGTTHLGRGRGASGRSAGGPTRGIAATALEPGVRRGLAAGPARRCWPRSSCSTRSAVRGGQQAGALLRALAQRGRVPVGLAGGPAARLPQLQRRPGAGRGRGRADPVGRVIAGAVGAGAAVPAGGGRRPGARPGSTARSAGRRRASRRGAAGAAVAGTWPTRTWWWPGRPRRSCCPGRCCRGSCCAWSGRCARRCRAGLAGLALAGRRSRVRAAFATASGMNAGVVPLLQLVAVPVVALVVRRPTGCLAARRWPCWAGARCWCGARPRTGWCRRCWPCVPARSWCRTPRPCDGIFGAVLGGRGAARARPLAAVRLRPGRGLGAAVRPATSTTRWWCCSASRCRRSPRAAALLARGTVAPARAAAGRGGRAGDGRACTRPADPTAVRPGAALGVRHVPGAAAFRTTNKIGSLLVLGRGAAGRRRGRGRVRRWRRPGAAAAGSCVALSAGAGRGDRAGLDRQPLHQHRRPPGVLAGRPRPSWTAGRPTSGCGSCPARCRRTTAGRRTGPTTCPCRCWTGRRWCARSSRSPPRGGQPARRAGHRAAGGHAAAGHAVRRRPLPRRRRRCCCATTRCGRTTAAPARRCCRT